MHRGGGEDKAEGEGTKKKKKQGKPMFLKDYPRENLLKRKSPAADEEGDDKRRTYMDEQEALKRDMVRDMHNVAEGIAKAAQLVRQMYRLQKKLVEHARGAFKAMTARGHGMSSRRRGREARKLKEEEERKEMEIEKGRLRVLGVEELMSKVKHIKEVVGLGNGDEARELRAP